MKDYGTTFRLEGCTEDNVLTGDMMSGRVRLGSVEEFRLTQKAIDRIMDSLEDFSEEELYDVSPLNSEGDWLLACEGAEELEKTGFDLPPELEGIVGPLLECATEAECPRSMAILKDLMDLKHRNPDRMYLDCYEGVLRRPIGRRSAVLLAAEARSDCMQERGLIVAETLFLDLLEQAGYGDVADAWRRAEPGRLLRGSRERTERTPRSGSGPGGPAGDLP